MLVNTVTLGLVIFPFAVIDITLGMIKLAFSIGLVLEPLSVVFSAIRPKLHTVPMAVQPFPLSCENGSIFKLIWVIIGWLSDGNVTVSQRSIDAATDVPRFVHLRIHHLLIIQANVTLRAVAEINVIVGLDRPIGKFRHVRFTVHLKFTF